MANYTADEVQAAVEKIVRSTVRHPTGILGDRKLQTSFNDLQEAAAGVYILYFNAPFYTLYLGAARIKDLVQTQAGTVNELIDAAYATNRLVTPISDLSPLVNARAALEELEAAVAGRSQGFSDIQKVPAFRRYAQNLDAFLSDAGGNLKGVSQASLAGSDGSTGQSVIDTPLGARQRIPSLARSLRDQHDELIRRVKLLAGAMEDFASLNLPRIAAQGVISRARDVLNTHYSDLSALSPVERLENLRAITLDLLTQRPLVEKYGAAVAPSEFITTSGLATAFSDGTHLATPAVLESDRFGPYDILESDHFIKLTMDGGASFEYPLPLGLIAELTGVLAEPFDIQPDRDQLKILFDSPDNVSPVVTTVPITNGTRTAAQVAADINAAFAGSDLICEEVFNPLKYASPVTVSSLGGSNARFTILGGSLSGLGIAVGDEIDILDGPNAGTTWVISAVGAGGTTLDASGPGPVTPVGLPGASIEVGPAARVLRLRDTLPVLSLAARRAIRLVRTGGEEDTCAAVLGFFAGMESRSRPVAAKDVAANIAVSTSALTADAIFVATRYVGSARSDPSDAGKVILSVRESEATVTSGLMVTFTLPDSVEGIGPSDLVVIRSSLELADVGQVGIITSAAGNAFTASFSSSITGGSVGIEIGPDVFFLFGDVLNITSGPNQGRYTVREAQGVGTSAPFELLLDAALPVPKDGADPVRFEVTFGQERVRFKSRSAQTTSSVRVENGSSGSAATYFFDPVSLPASARGTTPWLQFANYPSGASVGDLVQLFESQYNLVSREYAIVGLEQGSRVLKITPEIESTASISFDFDAPNPFGRIRVAQVADYTTLKTRLDAWLARAEQQDAYFRDLARFLNPLLTNENPTISQVNDATNQLKKLLSVLTEAGAEAYGTVQTPDVTAEDTLELALSEYKAPAEEPVDTLLATFRNKGSDRAIDLLVEGQFSTFFNLDMDGVSYSGTLMKSLREFAREDLPVRKTNRREAGGQALIGTIPNEKDFEFTTDDADSPGTPEAPIGFDTPSPGENF